MNVRVKQMKTKVTKRTKENEDGSVSVNWEVTVGSAMVRVYSTPHGDRELFTVSYWVDRKRKREVLPTFDKAIAVAKKAGENIARGDLGAADLTAAQRVACVRALQLLAPTKVPIEVAAGEYAQARSMLKGRASVLAAIEYFVRKHEVPIEPRRVAEVITECLQAKRQDRLSERYLRQLDYDLKRFEKRFKGFIGDVAGRDIDAWLRDLGVSGRTRNNIRMSVQTLMGFAKSKRYVAKDHDEMEAVPLAKELDGAIEIFTPAELREVLGVARPELLPFLTIGGFAGVRHAEIQRLDWRDIQFEDGIIEIHAKKAKTAGRRVVPLLDNLKALLKAHRKESGPVCELSNHSDAIEELVRQINRARRAAWAEAKKVSQAALDEADGKAGERLAAMRKAKKRIPRGELPPAGAETAGDEGWAAFKWKHNALRHSFISYRVADIQNVAQVALEAGNSPQMIFKHYRELVRPAAAKEWFALGLEVKQAKPTRTRQPKNVVVLSKVA